MTCSNKKVDCGKQIDRITDLPSHIIIDDILRRLNIIDQVRTSILSRKWRFDSGALDTLVCLLESAPNLVELVIKDFRGDTQVPYDSEELEHSSYCLSQLRTVKITTGDRFQLAMSLIRFILAISPSLETLTFHVGIHDSQLDASMLRSISEDLLLMERASQRAKIVFLHKDK